MNTKTNIGIEKLITETYCHGNLKIVGCQYYNNFWCPKTCYYSKRIENKGETKNE